MYDELIQSLLHNFEAVVHQSTPAGTALWNHLLKVHPADLGEILGELSKHQAQQLFLAFPMQLKKRVFDEVSHPFQIVLLERMDEDQRSDFLQELSIDDLTDFFEDLSDAELKKYLQLLHKKDRARVISLLKFDPETAGGIMYSDVLTLMEDFTVEKSIHIVQRLRPSRALHQKIYVTTQNNELRGYINLEDLVLRSPKTRLSELIHPNELIINVQEDQQEVAQKMMHYGVSNVPVVGSDGTFLGVIPSEALAEIIEEEASEDIYRMSAVAPIKHAYFDTSLNELLYKRGSILIILLLLQTFSSMIIAHYEAVLYGFLTYFVSMLTSTGGNASSQTSAFAIQGLASGEIDEANSRDFVRREVTIATILGAILACVSFLRITITHYLFPKASFSLLKSVAVSCSLFSIVWVSIALGSSMPFILRRIGIDPAHSAGPILTTVIDIIGILIYCLVSSWIMWIFG